MRMSWKVMRGSEERRQANLTMVRDWDEDRGGKLSAEIEAGQANPFVSKADMAQEITAIYHAAEKAAAARQEWLRIFSQREAPSEMPEVSCDELKDEEGLVDLVDLLLLAGFCGSRGEAKRLIEQGAARVNDEKITDFRARFAAESGDILRAGRRRFARLRVS